MIETTERAEAGARADATARETILGLMEGLDERSLASLMDYAAYLRELERRENEEDIRLAKEALRRIESGEERTYSLEEVERELGL